MDLQPTLVGERLILRPMMALDWDDLYAAASDPLIWEQHPNHDRWQEPVFQRFFEKALACGGALTVLDRADGSVIGTSRYYNPNPEAGEVTIGYSFLTRAYWGGVFNREMKNLMIDHAHRFMRYAIFSVDAGNLRSQAALRKIGATPRPVDPAKPDKIMFEVANV